jgi:hypothetical protein
MKLITGFLVLSYSLAGFSQSFNELVLKAIKEMPIKGGYVLTSESPKKLRDSFSWNLDELNLNPKTAIPSYCTTATYAVFFKVLKSYWSANGYPAKDIQELYKPNLEADGVRIWGRWNANGPGTAKLFHDADLGTNFSDISKARPGDFLKIWWNEEIGKKESGHSVVYLRSDEATITFWSSNTITNGYGERTIPRTMAKRLLFSRLIRPENAVKMKDQPLTDEFLASMLTRESSWSEVSTATGIEDSF